MTQIYSVMKKPLSFHDRIHSFGRSNWGALSLPHTRSWQLQLKARWLFVDFCLGQMLGLHEVRRQQNQLLQQQKREACDLYLMTQKYPSIKRWLIQFISSMFEKQHINTLGFGFKCSPTLVPCERWEVNLDSQADWKLRAKMKADKFNDLAIWLSGCCWIAEIELIVSMCFSQTLHFLASYWSQCIGFLCLPYIPVHLQMNVN